MSDVTYSIFTTIGVLATTFCSLIGLAVVTVLAFFELDRAWRRFKKAHRESLENERLIEPY